MEVENLLDVAIAYVGGFIICGLIGLFGSDFIMQLYDDERPFEPEQEKRQENRDAAGKVSTRVGLFAGVAWILYRFFSK
ncbi:MAG: hypothetical protein ABSH38_01425 [Verrucomicrobiota bacterium]|jgi:hypothetical protein